MTHSISVLRNIKSSDPLDHTGSTTLALLTREASKQDRVQRDHINATYRATARFPIGRFSPVQGRSLTLGQVINIVVTARPYSAVKALSAGMSSKRLSITCQNKYTVYRHSHHQEGKYLVLPAQP